MDQTLLRDTDSSLLPAVTPPKLYSARWWILFTFSLFAFNQGMLWAIPGPLSDVTSTLYNISDDTIQLLINYGPIFYLPFSVPLAYWMDRPGGLRQSVIWGITIVFLGQLCRNLARDASATSIALVHISYILNAIAGPVAMGAVGKISEVWFPPSFRATATSIMAEANLGGGAAAQVLGPLIVQTANWDQLMYFLYGCTAVSVLNLLCVLLYFPSHPPTSPSLSASGVQEAEASMNMKTFWVAMKKLARNRSFLVLICAYGFSTGMYGSWATVLSLNLTDCAASYVGWLSFSSTIAGNIGGLILGRVVDKFRKMKRLLVVLMGISGVCFGIFALLCAGIIKGDVICHEDGSPGNGLWPLFVLGVAGGLTLNSAIPLFYELSLEVTHPIPEGIVCTMLTNMNNIGGLIFLGIPVSQFGSAWMNWLFASTIIFFTILLALFFDEKTLRYNVDMGGGEGEEEEEAAGGHSKPHLKSSRIIDTNKESSIHPLMSIQ